MLQIVYESRATEPVSAEEIENILIKARARNAEVDVTGMLVYHEGMFLQILEGPDDKVTEVYERIEKDARHGDVWVLARMQIEERSFARWSMGITAAFAREQGCTVDIGDLKWIKKRVDRLQSRKWNKDCTYTAKLVRKFLDRLAPEPAF